jgi:hypothetical protein
MPAVFLFEIVDLHGRGAIYPIRATLRASKFYVAVDLYGRPSRTVDDNVAPPKRT